MSYFSCINRAQGRVLPTCIAATVLLLGGAAFADTYQVSGNQLLQNGVPKSYRGANTLHVFGGNSGGTDSYNMDMIRVFIGNLNEQPLTGYAIQDSNGAWLYPLQNLVDDNRARGKITVICPFNWDGTEATKFTGLYPPWQSFYNDYKARMRAIANQFKDQPDVFIEVWNEPYPWDNGGGYASDHSWWLNDMKDMVSNIRSTGYNGVVVVPGNRQGQGEEAVIARGRELLDWDAPRNLLFDIHAYERWLIGLSVADVESRIKAMRDTGVAVVFGEVGPLNAGEVMNPANFLTAARRQDVSVLAWLWKQDGNDKDALQDANENPNNNQNYNWGSLFRDFSIAPHSLSASVSRGGEFPALAVDNDGDTYWSTGAAQSAGQTLIIGLGAGQSWNRLTMSHGNRPDDYPRGYTLSVSDDGVNWTQKATGSGQAGTTNIWPGPQWSRWIKIEQTGSAGNWWSVAEVSVSQN